MAQSDDDRRVAGWTVDKFKNGALSAYRPLVSGWNENFQGPLGAYSVEKLENLLVQFFR
jgi:hypothetical protein